MKRPQRILALALAMPFLATSLCGAASVPEPFSQQPSAPTGLAPQAAKQVTLVATTKAYLNVRLSPSARAKRIASVSKGKKLTVLSTASNGWRKVTVGKKTGWISGKYVTVRATYTASTVKAKTSTTMSSPGVVKNTPSKLPRPEIYWEDLNWRTSHPVSSKNPAKVRAYVKGGEGRTVQLQKWTGKKWSTVSSGRVNSWVANVRLDAPDKADRTDYYRLYIPATSKTADYTTKAMKIERQNPDKFTGERKAIYQHIKGACPTLAIEIHKKNRTYDGKAFLGYDSIAVVGGLSNNPSYLKLVALHECAHHLQYAVALKNGGWEKFQKRTNAIYGQKGSLGMEMNATCTAQALGAKLRSGAAYTSNCTGKRGTAGKAVAAGRMP